VFDDRRAELVANVRSVRQRIVRATEAAGRASAEVTLVAVTKFFPAADAALLCELGVGDLGESRDQEAAAKVAQVNDLVETCKRPRWHFVGKLQTNKARSVAGYADLVHSVDRPALVTALDAGAERVGRRLDVLVQVSLDDDTTRGGVAVPQVLDLAGVIASSSNLRLRGVMAVAPLGADPDEAFARMCVVAESVRQAYPEAQTISAGMSGDMESAIRHGATHVRIGTALLGRRKAHLG
jgi:PLP dependent protein